MSDSPAERRLAGWRAFFEQQQAEAEGVFLTQRAKLIVEKIKLEVREVLEKRRRGLA